MRPRSGPQGRGTRQGLERRLAGAADTWQAARAVAGRRIFCARQLRTTCRDAQTNYGNPMTRSRSRKHTQARPEAFTKTPRSDARRRCDYPSRARSRLRRGIGGGDRRPREGYPLRRPKTIWGITGERLSDRDGPAHQVPGVLNLIKTFDCCAPLGPCILVNSDLRLNIITEVTVESAKIITPMR